MIEGYLLREIERLEGLLGAATARIVALEQTLADVQRIYGARLDLHHDQIKALADEMPWVALPELDPTKVMVAGR